MNTQTATVTAINPSLEIESTNAPLVNVNNTSAMVLNGDSMDKMLKFSQMMATSKITIPKHLQGNAGDCFAIVMQAMQWGMNPFAVAQKTHLVNGVLGYEAQLVNAVINSRAPITTRLNYEWFGDWSKVNGKTSNADDVGVIVSATMKGETEPRVLSVSMAQVGNVRNSPLWVNDPRQQLAYLATKRWSRLY
nr:recombinase RecT [Agitococcus sp.]